MNLRSFFVLLLGALVACVTTGCSSPQSTRMTGTDLTDMAAELGQKLRDSDWMKTRTAESVPAVITWDKLENLTMDVMTRSEQWSMMMQVRDSAGMVQLGRDKAFTIVLPAELKAEGEQRGAYEAGFAAKRAPTHRMDATMRSATRAAKGDRTDTYLCDFRITTLSDGAIAWSDTVALKRAARGASFD